MGMGPAFPPHFKERQMTFLTYGLVVIVIGFFVVGK